MHRLLRAQVPPHSLGPVSELLSFEKVSCWYTNNNVCMRNNIRKSFQTQIFFKNIMFLKNIYYKLFRKKIQDLWKLFHPLENVSQVTKMFMHYKNCSCFKKMFMYIKFCPSFDNKIKSSEKSVQIGKMVHIYYLKWSRYFWIFSGMSEIIIAFEKILTHLNKYVWEKNHRFRIMFAGSKKCSWIQKYICSIGINKVFMFYQEKKERETQLNRKRNQEK
jgi:hypothetical protein